MSSIRRDVSPSHSTWDGTRPRSPAEALEPGRAPARPRGYRGRGPSKALYGAVRVVSGVMTLLLALLVSAGASALFLDHLFSRPGPLEVSRVVVIPKGEGRIQIAERLESEGVIGSRWVFVASHLIEGWYRGRVELKAGEYEIKKNASMRDVLATLEEGKSILYKVMIPEGLTSAQIVERVKQEPNLSGEITEVPAEGTLLPDTYRFSKGTARAELIERMKVEQRRFVDGLWEQRQAGLPIETKEAAVTLASIVEKETGRADERERVAGVFVNRLKKGMRLQSDPTIVYGVAGGQGMLGRSITRADIEQKTPYNTYQVDGLPPGPICNPGRPAIEATLNPAKTNDIYFVADGSGGHTFSDTLKDHNAAVAKWRKIEKDMKTKADAPEGTAGATAPDAPPADAALGDAAGGAIPNPPAEEAPKSVAASQVGPAGSTVAVGVARASVQASSIPLPVRKPKK